jgi:hypothetical protein
MTCDEQDRLLHRVYPLRSIERGFLRNRW